MALTPCIESGYNFVSTSWFYGGTYNQFGVYLKKFKIDVKWVEGQDPKAIAAAIDDKTQRPSILRPSETQNTMSQILLLLQKLLMMREFR